MFGADTLARYPHGSYLENLAGRKDGSVLFTNYYARRLEAWSDGRGATTFAELPVLAVNVLELPDGILVTGHGVPFTEGPDKLRGTNQALLLDRSGTVRRTIPLPGAVFVNGMVALSPERVLVADWVLGRVWDLELGTGRVKPWLDHPLLAADPQRPYVPGVNGLRRASDGTVLISNSANRKLIRVALDPQGMPSGEPTTVAELPGIDDFASASDGTIYLATHGHDVLKLALDGTTTPVLSQGVDGNTAVALSTDGASLFILGTGGLFEGGKGEAALVRLRLN